MAGPYKFGELIIVAGVGGGPREAIKILPRGNHALALRRPVSLGLVVIIRGIGMAMRMHNARLIRVERFNKSRPHSLRYSAVAGPLPELDIISFRGDLAAEECFLHLRINPSSSGGTQSLAWPSNIALRCSKSYTVSLLNEKSPQMRPMRVLPATHDFRPPSRAPHLRASALICGKIPR